MLPFHFDGSALWDDNGKLCNQSNDGAIMCLSGWDSTAWVRKWLPLLWGRYNETTKWDNLCFLFFLQRSKLCVTPWNEINKKYNKGKVIVYVYQLHLLWRIVLYCTCTVWWQSILIEPKNRREEQRTTIHSIVYILESGNPENWPWYYIHNSPIMLLSVSF